MNNNNLYGSLMTDSLVKFQESLDSISNMYLNVFNLNDIHTSITSLQTFDNLNNTINSMIETANLHYVQESLRSSLENIGETLQNSFFPMENLSTLIGNSLGNLKIDVEKSAYIIEDEDDYITFSEANELKEDIIDIIKNNVSEKSLDICKDKWKDRHPYIYDVILLILGSIIGALVGVFIESSITNAIIKQNSKVYDDFSNKSSIMFNLPENSKVTIIDNSINYYYKILYTDTENNEEIEGYIPKRNAIIK